jgi:hypothetical protein
MTVAPRALIVTRPTEYDELLGRHGSRQQAAFFLKQRGLDDSGGGLDELDRRHAAQAQAVQAVSAAIPVDWRRASLTRADLDRFVFGPEDVIIAVGQDGLVANVAKYLDGQRVVGVNPDPTRNPGVLVRNAASSVAGVLKAVATNSATLERRAMVQIDIDDGQQLVALNEIFVGDGGHQSARWQIAASDQTEHQSSSGLLVGTGTGATGWCASVHRERSATEELPPPLSTDLAWFVREAWPSPWTGTSLTAGRLSAADQLVVRCESDHLVAFGDGIEDDHLNLAWGQTATIHLATKTLVLVV